MADTTTEKVKIGDVSSQLTKASRLVVSTDGFWIQTGGDSAGNGQSVLIPAEFVRAYLTDGIKPSVGSNGNWTVNGKDLGVKAEGVTPKLRGGTLGIEVSYDGGKTWTQCVAYSDMDIDLATLEAEYKKVIANEDSRVTAENARAKAESSRVSAENSRVTAENARTKSETERGKAESDRKNAESLRQQNATDYTTHESDREQAEAERKAAEKQRETDFQTLSDGNAAQLAELKRLADSILNSQSVAPMTSVPASIFVETERTANVSETVNVAPTMFAPSTCNHSVIYKVYDGNAKVNYKGDVILPAEAGDVVIEVIPALNNGAARVVTIHAVEPTPILDLAGEQITDEKGEAITA